MDVIDFDKPEKSNVDFLEGMDGAPPGAENWIAPRPAKVESPSGASQSLEKVAQSSNAPQSPEDLQNLTPEEKVLKEVDKYLEEGRDFGIAADYDKTIADDSAKINPEIRQAFIDMIASGREVVIISSRGAGDVVKKVGIPGVSVIGTLGWETLDKNGKSHINEKFKPYQPQITGILRDVRERFLKEQLGRPIEVSNDPNIELDTPEGQGINLQRKGYNEEYPEGINLTLALSNLPPEAQERYGKALELYYNEAFSKQAALMSAKDQAALKELCGFKLRDGMTSDGKKTFDVEIRPTSQISKSKALIQLMRESEDPKRQAHFKDMPFHANWIYAGDHAEQDGPVMRAGHTADSLSQGKRGIFGIWSKPPNEEERAVRGVDAVVDGVTGNAKLMTEIASKVKQHSSSEQSSPQ
ncbi:MAG: hypothetical protein AAB521_04820 [Patescibacteria group bacterium]